MYKGRKFGWKPSLPDVKKKKYSATREMASRVHFPPMIDMRSVMPPIEDQGQLGTCVAHATCAALEFLELEGIKEGSGPVLFPDKQFDQISRLFLYYNSCAIDGDAGQDNGTTNTSMMKGIAKWGMCRESIWPYDPKMVSKQPPAYTYKEGAQHVVLSSYALNNSVIDQMKQCLVVGFPFLFGSTIYSSFMSDSAAETGIIPLPKPEEDLLGGHDLCCVGYEDARNSFLVRNSWGEGWGEKGYCWMPYRYLTNPDLTGDLWTIRKV